MQETVEERFLQCLFRSFVIGAFGDLVFSFNALLT